MMGDIMTFNPISGERRETSYKVLGKITGFSPSYLSTLKYRGLKLKELNCYIISSKTPIKELDRLMQKEIINDECWRDIPNSRYQVSNYGRYKSLQTDGSWRFMIPPRYSTKSSPRITMIINDKRGCYALHHFVFEYFVEKPSSKGLIRCHKDNNKYNNYAENLYWTTKSKYSKKIAPMGKSIPVIRINMETGEKDYYDSMADAGRDNYCSKRTIGLAIKQNRPAVGYMWKPYKIEED